MMEIIRHNIVMTRKEADGILKILKTLPRFLKQDSHTLLLANRYANKIEKSYEKYEAFKSWSIMYNQSHGVQSKTENP